jgi:nucleoid DNA-binding protein
MNRVELVEDLSQKMGVDKSVADKFLNAFADVIVETALERQPIQVSGFFSLTPKHRNARTGRNPKTGEKLDIPAKWVINFSLSKNLIAKIN